MPLTLSPLCPQNKLDSPDDHKNKPFPRPASNVDTVRAGVVVEDASRMADVLAAITAHVGPLLRSKNGFRRDADVSYGYRAFLGNLKLESGLTVGDVFGGENRKKWEAWAEAGRAADGKEPAEVKAVLNALLAMGASALLDVDVRKTSLTVSDRRWCERRVRA